MFTRSHSILIGLFVSVLLFVVSAVVLASSPGAACTDNSVFVADVTVPDGTAFAPGAAIAKTWRLKNTGTCAWGSGYVLKFTSGDKLGATADRPAADTAAGAAAEITVPMTAPAAPGKYTGLWQMVNPSGAAFGAKVSVNIEVTAGDAAAAAAAPATGAEAGQAGAPGLSQLAGHLVWEVFKAGANKPTYDIYVSKVDGTEPRLLWEWGRQPKMRRSDGRIALNGDGQGKDSVWGVNLDGSNAIQMTSRAEDSHPFWGPTGVRLLYDSETESNLQGKAGREWAVFIQDGIDKPVKPVGVRVANRGAAGRSPIWLENDWIIYTGCNYWAGGGSCGLYAVPSWGADEARQLTTVPNDLASDAAAERVLYSCRPDDNWDVCAINFDGSQQVNLTNSPTNDGIAAFSPDGKSIAFLSDRSGAWAMWIMNADGSNPVKAFDLPGAMGDDWISERISWGP